MTIEEAEKCIKSRMCNNCGVYLGGGKCSDNCKVIEAIKALEQESKLLQALEQEKGAYNALVKNTQCSDAISRSDMLDAVGHGTTYTSEDLQRIIKVLPPVKPQEPKWILVSERLPEADESGKTFLVTDVLGKLHLSKFYFPLSNSDIDEPYWSGMIDVVAWMPLPKPYEPQESEEV